jgi:hypothetical protein
MGMRYASPESKRQKHIESRIHTLRERSEWNGKEIVFEGLLFIHFNNKIGNSFYWKNLENLTHQFDWSSLRKVDKYFLKKFQCMIDLSGRFIEHSLFNEDQIVKSIEELLHYGNGGWKTIVEIPLVSK